ncbi:MAG TPA: xanthine dehydrogenase family protein molybdopterin-binding subunit [Verrucomicrobiae bacterium]|nr:xanthine dehydrogenase family protein molybdopterin-binding subunit [Verrucomicrobiae bacterium]
MSSASKVAPASFAARIAKPSRREFLQFTAAGGAGLILGIYLPAASPLRAAPAGSQDFIPNAYVEISPSCEMRLWVARSEMGQGVRTSLLMILADELDADWSKIKIEQGDWDLKYGDMTTGGSFSVRSSWDPLRQAGATARAMLVAAAAERWHVPSSECTTGDSAVYHEATKNRLTYGEVAASAAELPVPKDVPVKTPKDYRLIGTNRGRVDAPFIVIGEAHYGIDTKLPGMLFAVVARPPVLGDRVKSFDPAPALAVPGVRKVFEVPAVELQPLFGEERAPHSGHQHYLWGGVAVVADSTWQAMAGRKALQIEWESGAGADESTEKQRAALADLLKTPGKELKKIGDPDAAFSSAAKTVEAEYETPFVAHAPMEPPNCTASFAGGKCEVWAPTQNPGGMAASLASVLQIPPSAITIHITLIGGGFGRRLNIEYGVEAALVSKSAGAPVKIIWTREDDLRHDYYRPITRHRLRAALDSQNRVAGWSHHIAAPSTDGTYLGGEIPDTVGTELAGVGLAAGAVPNYKLEQSFLHTAVLRGYWRAVDTNWNHFAVHSFIDEVAAATGKDPLEMRREIIRTSQKPVAEQDDDNTGPVHVSRLLGVLELAAEKGDWGKPIASGRGRGIAGLYAFGTYVAQVAEVTVSKDGGVKVDRVICAVDCGQVINPDMVKAQIQGGVVFGLSAALFEQIEIENGQVQQANFDTFPVLHIDDAPRVEVHIVPGHESPGGIGEPGVPSAAPAVANAIFAATGKRLRRLPFQTQELAQG